MTPEQQRIKIAEACGWKPEPDPYYFDNLVWTNGDEFCSTVDLPNYCNDLNAMHEAEVSLENEIATTDQYWTLLAELTMADDEELATCTRYRYVGNATAHQRAEAFLKTLGLWEDEK